MALAWAGGAMSSPDPLADAAAELWGSATHLPAPGSVGELAVFGPRAAPVAAGRRDNRLAPFAAAAEAGRGRVVVLAHDGYLTQAPRDGALGEFLLRAIRWVGHSRAGAPMRVAVRSGDGLETWMAAAGFEIVPMEAADRADVVVAVGRLFGESEVGMIAAFVERGGGLVIGETAWSWNRHGRSLAEHPANRLVGRWGVTWTDGIVETTGAGGFEKKPVDLCHALAALDIALAPDGRSAVHLRQAEAALLSAARWAPSGDPLFRPRLDAVLGGREFEPPSAERPVRVMEPLRRLWVARLTGASLEAPLQRVGVLPGSDRFPGAVPGGAPRVAREVSFDPSAPGWTSTGLYAPPGEVITVVAPAPLVSRRLSVRIGAHTDEIWHLNEWKRWPEITREFPIASDRTSAAAGAGGLIYICSAGGADVSSAVVRVEGAVEAPLYRRGTTTEEEWRRQREAPAPWGEIAGDRVILTLPSDRLRSLADPAGVAAVWDRILDACADLAGMPRERARPERIVPDLQISAGYMHSGYPIMTHADQYGILADTNAVLSGQWGLFHEIGHNHQQRDWTFDGTGEVTVNLFTSYVMETICGKPPSTGHPAITPEARAKAWVRYDRGGRRFEDWKQDPFLALQMYMQLREAFGWEPFRRVFAEYRKLDSRQRPRTDDHRRDQWMIRFSRAVGKNLGPFFEAWGVPTSEAARASLADLPGWMPADWPPAADRAN